MPPRHVSVIGGGITGLSSAFHLVRRFPNTKVTLFEKQNRLGGWLKSERVEIGDQNALVETGPRTLRPNSLALLELIHLLKLEGRVIRTPSNAAAAKNRFLHIPGTEGLKMLPSSLTGLLTSGMAPMLVFAVLRDLFSWSNRAADIEDESVDSFLSRRFGPKFAGVFGSALVHGIYAADSRVLSVRAAFPTLWDAHIRGAGSVARSMFNPKTRKSQEAPNKRYSLGGVVDFMRDTSVFSFKNGVSEIPAALHDFLKCKPNFEIVHDPVLSLAANVTSPNLSIKTSTRTYNTSNVVSAIELAGLSKLIESGSLPHLTANPISSVTVVNLVFDSPSEKIHPAGFGYLIPRTTGMTVSNLHPLERAMIGTVFDSSALSAQDSTASLTKLTIMIGGPHGAPQPSEVDIRELISILSRHLSRTLPQPVAHRIHYQKDCIPTPTVDHLRRMEELKIALQKTPWNGRLTVIGAGVDGVSVGDCAEAGRRAAFELE